MNTSSFTYLLAHPDSINASTLEDLNEVIREFPYFQAARALQLKGLKDTHSFLYNDALKVTAAHTTDRTMLFEYITSENFLQHNISESIVQQSDAIKEIEVESEDVSAHVSRQINEQLRKEVQKAEAILNPDLFERKSISQDPIPSKKLDSTSEITTDSPLPFTKQDTHSFAEWLKLTKATPIVRNTDNEDLQEVSKTTQEEKERKFQLIDKFIQERPRLEPKEVPVKNKNLAKPYTQSPDTLMTETLAKVYLQQKNYKKAIQAYKILILKNPEKSGFFADQIRAIEKLIKTEGS